MMDAMPMAQVNVARDFSPFLGGRIREHGGFSGQEFRETFLAPNILSRQGVCVNFNGVIGLPSSFLEEAFGGLVRAGLINSFDEFKRYIRIVADQPSISNAPRLVERYIRDALGR